MNTLIVWFLIAIPKSECNDKIAAQRAAAAESYYQASQSTTNVTGIAMARRALEEVQEPLKIRYDVRLEEPKAIVFGPCYDVYTVAQKMPRARP